jgi:DegV family protein with EDD domain
MSTIPEPDGQQAHTGVAVVTDSTTYLPPALRQRRQIAQVSLYVGWDGERLPEGEYELDDFYSRLRSSPSLPSTSQPSVGDFLAVYEPLAAAGRDVVSIHIAAGLSGTCESAREAARTIAGRGLPGRVEVIDGETGAGGLGCLVLAAAEAAERGLSLEQVAATVSETRAGLEIWFCLDTLEYLRKGGRIGAAQALLGSALKIKPILTFGTEIAPVGRVRTARRAHERMVAYLRELHERGASGWIVQHAQLPEEAASLVAAGEEILGSEPLFCTEVGPVLGAHLGSGMLVGGVGLAPATAE